MTFDTEVLKASLREELVKLERARANIQDKLGLIDLVERIARQYQNGTGNGNGHIQNGQIPNTNDQVHDDANGKVETEPAMKQ